jgi:hypothetical protein
VSHPGCQHLGGGSGFSDGGAEDADTVAGPSDDEGHGHVQHEVMDHLEICHVAFI